MLANLNHDDSSSKVTESKAQCSMVQGQLTTQDEVEVGHVFPLLVDGAVPVDGLNGHAPAQILPRLIWQLSQEGVQEHENNRQLINDGEITRGRQGAARGQHPASVFTGWLTSCTDEEALTAALH